MRMDVKKTTRRHVMTGLSAGAAATFGAPAQTLAKATAVRMSPDPKGLLRHRFGVNYVPSQNWYYAYNAWNKQAVADDLSRIAELGADHIRLMVIWPWFQPNPRAMSEAHLDHLDDILELAAARQIDVFPSIFTGWLSGYHFNPNFYDSEPFYTSPKWELAQRFYIDGLSHRLKAHANFLGFDLGNELACNWKAPTAEGEAWMERRFDQMKSLFPDKVHVNGVDHTSWFQDDTFSAKALVAQQEIVSLHCWPFWTGAGDRGGTMDKPYTHLIAGMASLARSLGNAPMKPIWAQEFGACAVEMPESQLSLYMETTLQAGIEAGVSWFTWWSSHDVNKKFDFHPFEYGLGLIDASNTIKQQGRTFRALAEPYRKRPVEIPTKILPPPPTVRTVEGSWEWLMNWMETVPAVKQGKA